MPAGRYRSSIEGKDDRSIILQGYEDGRSGLAPRAWELYPDSEECRAVYRREYKRGWNELMGTFGADDEQRFVADYTAEGHPIVLDLLMSPATVIPCGSQGQAERVAAVLNAEFARADDSPSRGQA